MDSYEMNSIEMKFNPNQEPQSETNDLEEIANENKNYWMLLNWLISNEEAKSKLASKKNRFWRFDKLFGTQHDLDKKNNSTAKEEPYMVSAAVKKAKANRKDSIWFMLVWAIAFIALQIMQIILYYYNR